MFVFLYPFSNILYAVLMEVCIFSNTLGKLLDHVLVEMGYGLKPQGQNPKKSSPDQGESPD